MPESPEIRRRRLARGFLPAPLQIPLARSSRADRGVTDTSAARLPARLSMSGEKSGSYSLPWCCNRLGGREGGSDTSESRIVGSVAWCQQPASADVRGQVGECHPLHNKLLWRPSAKVP